MSPVPPATSSNRCPSRGASQSIIASFHKPMDAAAHHVVHHVVTAGDIGKDTVNHPGLFGLIDRLEPEMRGSRVGPVCVVAHQGLCSGLVGPCYRPRPRGRNAALHPGPVQRKARRARTSRSRDSPSRPRPGAGGRGDRPRTGQPPRPALAVSRADGRPFDRARAWTGCAAGRNTSSPICPPMRR
jgi:hypothetical protein